MTREHLIGREGFAVVERRVDHADSVRLLRAFYDDQVTRYGVAESVDLDPAVYAPPGGTFVVGYAHGRPVGCAGGRWYDRHGGVVEIKKAFLIADVRGQGFGRALLAWVEAWARTRGAHRAILETGVRNTAAMELFRSSGYWPMAPYVAGRDPAINRAFVKQLASVPVSVVPVGVTAGSATAR